MKIYLSLLALLLASVITNAQLSKGQWIAGGAGAFSYTEDKTEQNGVKTNSINAIIQVSPGVGYFIMDRLAVGISAAIQTDRTATSIDGSNSASILYYARVKSSTKGTGVSPFVRYYVLPSSKKINILAQLSYAYIMGKIKQSEYTEELDLNNPGGMPSISTYWLESKTKKHAFTFMAGPAFFLHPKVSLELGLGYTYATYKDIDSKSNGFVAGMGFQIHLDALKKGNSSK